uniref:RHS repeat-associated core domain-containing protein n=1 Tax=Enterocloster clostridioformis TaxID=1531 RepID=UPI0025A58F3E
YNAESFNPNMDAQYLRARYYSVKTAGFISEDSYLGDITDPLTLNRYNYVKGSPLNYMDPSGHVGLDIFAPPSKYVHTGDIPVANDSNATRPNDNGNVQGPPPSPVPNSFGEHAKTLLSKLFEIAIKRKTKDECQREWEEITGGDPMYGFDSPTDDFIDIIIGANYALMNKGIETVGLLNNLIYNYRYRYENEAMVKNAEQWVVDNLIYDPANFYLGKLFGDIILASYSVKEIELLLSKLGAIAGGGSIGAAGALGATAQAEIDELLVVAGLEDSAAAGAFLSVVYASGLPEDWEKFRKAFKEVNGNTSSSSGSRIIKETDNYIDYVNESGTKVRIPKQTEGSISKSIQSNLTSTNTGTAIEAKVANYINENTNASVVDFGNKIKTVDGLTLGDIDISTSNQIIEVKSSIASVKMDQLLKYTDPTHSKYFNFGDKEVILYIDKAIDMSVPSNIKMIEQIENLGVKIVNGLDQLGGVIR